MELPFTIKFFKKIEYFQDLRRMDNNALNQQAGNVTNTWDIEKKVLRWLYPGHKHLGSPIFIQYFFTEKKAAKRHFIYNFKLWILENETELQKLILIDSRDIERKRKQLNKIRDWKSKIEKIQIQKIEEEFEDIENSDKKGKVFDEGCVFDHNFEEIISKISGKDSFYLSEREIEIAKKDVRHVLKNLVAKDFAKFSNEKNEDDGILITAKGLLMGEVIWECTDIDPTCNNLNIYWKVHHLIYSNWIVLGWLLASSGIIFAISSVFEKFGLLDNIASTTKSFFNYNNSSDIRVATANVLTVFFIIFVTDVLFLSVSSFFRFFLGKHKQNK